MRHIPNILSCLRILMVGGFAALFLTGRYLLAMGIYVLAFFTDVLDGYLARRNNWITPVGKLLDPVADKLMIFAALACILIGKSGQTSYLILLVLAAVQQILMILGGIVMLGQKVVVQSDWYGKTATGVFAAGVVLALLSFPFPVFTPWDICVLAVAVGLSYIALVHYALTQVVNRRKAKPAGPDASDTAEK